MLDRAHKSTGVKDCCAPWVETFKYPGKVDDTYNACPLTGALSRVFAGP